MIIKNNDCFEKREFYFNEFVKKNNIKGRMKRLLHERIHKTTKKIMYRGLI
jgi:hypothetical protein